MQSFIEISPLSTEISRHAKWMVMDAEGQRTARRTTRKYNAPRLHFHQKSVGDVATNRLLYCMQWITFAVSVVYYSGKIKILLRVNGKSIPCDFCWYFSNACIFLHKILRNCYAIKCTLYHKVLFNYMSKWQNYVVSSETTPIFTALHGMQSRYSDGNSVCPSVCPSVRLSVKRVHCDKTEKSYV